MFQRQLSLPKKQSILLLGARGTGKSTWIRNNIDLASKSVLYLDLLDPELEAIYQTRPQTLGEQLQENGYNLVVIDEVQRAPKLLDIAHHWIEKKRIQFILTGSSARKIRRGAANLLAGRALSFELYPFTADELGTQFNLNTALQFGTLPRLFDPETDPIRFLRSYANTYLKEEILQEQLVRKLVPFRAFLAVSAQMNGKVIEATKIARDLHTDPKTIQAYFQILEDTLVGFFLPQYSRSIRKRQGSKPKFYWFDPGVKRALEQTLELPLRPGTSAYGEAFEHWVILEFHRQARYQEKEVHMSFLRTSQGTSEIDLIVESPGRYVSLIEIKSSGQVDDSAVKRLLEFKDDFPDAKLFIASQEPRLRKKEGVTIGPWQEILRLAMP